MIKFMPIKSDAMTNDPFDCNYRWPDEPRHPVFDTYFCVPMDPEGLLLAVAEHFYMDDDGRAADVDWFVAIAATGRPVRGHAYDIKLTARDIVRQSLLDLVNNQTMDEPSP